MRPFRYPFLAALALAASCASNDVTTPTVDVNALVDQTGVATYSATALSASVPGVTATVPVLSSSTSSCTYSVTNQRFDCAPVSVNGLTIILKHDTDLPRPYSRSHLVQGTRGIVRRFPEFKVRLERPGENQRVQLTSKVSHLIR